MVTLDRIRLTGLLRKKPRRRGFFYWGGPVRTRLGRRPACASRLYRQLSARTRRYLPARSCRARLGRFDSYAAPLSREHGPPAPAPAVTGRITFDCTSRLSHEADGGAFHPGHSRL